MGGDCVALIVSGLLSPLNGILPSAGGGGGGALRVSGLLSPLNVPSVLRRSIDSLRASFTPQWDIAQCWRRRRSFESLRASFTPQCTQCLEEEH